jgi:hypothetical protein
MTDWPTLEHAYGGAADVPALLDKLSPDGETSVWDELWSRLCHQGTVYSASFAALPALAQAARRWQPRQRAQVLALAASILASDDVYGGDRNDFVCPVEWVVPHFEQLCRESLAEPRLSKHDFIYLLQAARFFAGDRFWGQELDHLASGEFLGACPHCGTALYLVIGDYGFFTTADDWVQRPGKTPGAIEVRAGIKRTPIEPNNAMLPGEGRELYAEARAARQDEVAEWIRHVFGTSGCPACGKKFAVRDAIV